MGRNLLVIVGAGAPHDLVPTVRPRSALGGTPRNPLLLPPLTDQVFNDNAITKAILDRYHGARQLAGVIRRGLLGGAQLEPILKQLSQAETGPVSRQFPEIPLYLQDLFPKICHPVEGYTNQPFNYQVLLHKLFNSGLERIVFVTTNYDTLLDDELAPTYLGSPIADMDSYIRPHCMLIKLHGSTNWMKRLHSPRQVNDLARYLNLISDLGSAQLKTLIAGPIEIKNPLKLPNGRWTADNVYYPALSVPLGQYDLNYACPVEHVDALKEFLPTCYNVLAIGHSGRDDDLLELLRIYLPVQLGQFAIVDYKREAAFEAYERFQASSAHGENASPVRYHSPNFFDNGFSGFILGDGLDQFIDLCR